jgi:hypothetical protein
LRHFVTNPRQFAADFLNDSKSSKFVFPAAIDRTVWAR